MSAAEGFFFLSGMMIGIVRGRKEQHKPLRGVSHKLLRRSVVLYAWAVGMTLAFTWVAHIIGPHPYLKAGAWQGDMGQLIWHTLTLQYVYSWSDFLRYYAVYLALSVGAIALLRTHKSWVIAVLSVVAWAFGRHQTEFLTWQLLFFGGVLVGWYWQRILQWTKKLPKFLIALHYPLVIATVTYSAVITFNTSYADLHNQLAPYFFRAEMPPLRIGIFILWFSALYRFVRTHEALCAKTIGKLLIPLGQHSLYSYILHGVIVYFVHLWIPPQTPIYINIAITAATLGIIWLAIEQRFLHWFIPR